MRVWIGSFDDILEFKEARGFSELAMKFWIYPSTVRMEIGALFW